VVLVLVGAAERSCCSFDALGSVRRAEADRASCRIASVSIPFRTVNTSGVRDRADGTDHQPRDRARFRAAGPPLAARHPERATCQMTTSRCWRRWTPSRPRPAGRWPACGPPSGLASTWPAARWRMCAAVL